MDYDDVVTLFHEFGRRMHWMLSSQEWAVIGANSMESDFGEAPSEMLEARMRSPQVNRNTPLTDYKKLAMPK